MDKVQTGLRIPEDRYRELAALAERSGVSINTAVLMLVDIGLQVIQKGQMEVLHALPRKSEDTDE